MPLGFARQAVLQQPAAAARAASVAPPRPTVVCRSAPPRSTSPRWYTSWREDATRTDEDTSYSSHSNGNGNGSHASNNGDSWRSSSNGHRDGEQEEQDFRQSSWRQNAAHTASWDSDPEAAPYADDGYYAGDDEEVEQQLNQQRAGEEEEEEEGEGGGFFSDAFKAALQDALKRSPLYGEGGEESIAPDPSDNNMVEAHDKPFFSDTFRNVLKESLARQQSVMDNYSALASDDESTLTPRAAPPKEFSPMEELLATVLATSRHSLRRLNMIKNEVDAAIERETKQLERLEFALSKTQSDVAYYAALERRFNTRPRE
ncbi:hypothetical protein HYH03_004253 [Edaphochlamys debaryana]|uniref:Uncharacterized protein n=1 Tax=Edaphochlamys debaryana TaxID=47281 RepID=A0A836C3S4_9CHLO|nr:hypothetical protein HYH03_004253 [Edaphochlamys debaryana]|eukprot:KAG2497994.1 hypothetical protein HYH03_004253 [Edaphochlamys debaryana]